MTDLISRADAIEAVQRVVLDAEAIEALKALPSADTEPTVIRSRTLLPTKDFNEWAKRIKEVNPNAVVIPCDAEVVSADVVQGKWIYKTNDESICEEWECSKCGNWNFVKTDFCPHCGARMKGGDDK